MCILMPIMRLKILQKCLIKSLEALGILFYAFFVFQTAFVELWSYPRVPCVTWVTLQFRERMYIISYSKLHRHDVQYCNL